jgi:hypothetical protein
MLPSRVPFRLGVHPTCIRVWASSGDTDHEQEARRCPSIEAVHARQILDSPGNPSVVKLVPRLPVDEVEVVPVVEIRGPAHREEVIGALRPAGYTLAFG